MSDAVIDLEMCRPVYLPSEQWVEAAEEAIRRNPANAPLVMPRADGDEDEPPSPQHLAVLTSKYWGAKGVKLTVGFPFDSPDVTTRRMILAHMNAWGTRSNVQFVESATSPQVRIARTPGQGYYSYLGTDVLQIPRNQPTMNLDSFTSNTPEEEYRRVVRHEAGHTLGFPHEHARRDIIALLDAAKVTAEYARLYGWKARTVQEQILTPLEERAIMGTPSADTTSIMTYAFSGRCTRSGQPIPGGNDINESDYEFAAKLYPPVVAPPPPPPPAGGLIIIDLVKRTYSFPSDWKGT